VDISVRWTTVKPGKYEAENQGRLPDCKTPYEITINNPAKY